MILSVQMPSVEALLWELLASLPEEERERYAARVNDAACTMVHPLLDGHVLCSTGSDGAFQATRTL